MDRSTKRRRVCLFGTSADPPTGDGGHRGIVSALAALPDIDAVVVLPVYRHMFASKRNKQTGYDDRLRMCHLAFRDIPNVVVSDAERTCFEKKAKYLGEFEKSSLRVGTADLLDSLIASEPDVDFCFALGSDTFLDLTEFKWKRSRDVFSLLGGRIFVIHREIDGDAGDELNRSTVEERVRKVNADRIWEVSPVLGVNDAFRSHEVGGTGTALGVSRIEATTNGPVKILNIPSLSTVSSSLVRSTRDSSILEECLVPDVLEFIRKNKLYAFSD